MEEADSTGRGLRHFAFLYRTADEYASAISDFVRAGSTAAEPVLVAVPGHRQAELRQVIDRFPSPASARVSFTDMHALGRNPARILPAIQDFMDACDGVPIRFVSEPAWPGRSMAEMREAIRHEALINVAFTGICATILCPYDVTGLPACVVADVSRTHPLLASCGSQEPSSVFAGPGVVPADCDKPLQPVPVHAEVLAYRYNLREVRDLITAHARKADLPEPRTVDLVLAVSEIAANTLRHTSAGGTISIWRTEDELLCELRDTGHITDPLAGRRAPDPDHPGGHGLWLVHQVCDLVQVRTDQAGTQVKLHMRLP
ncbi:MAG TPA: sensor histidine kinase [Streptosporangiaceae bacterium]|nr:sensor histidine kinase [Streptosporangiaceae bacterium]